MSPGHTGRVLTAVLAGVAVLLAGCSSNTAADDVVTITQRVTDGAASSSVSEPVTAPSVATEPGATSAPTAPVAPTQDATSSASPTTKPPATSRTSRSSTAGSVPGAAADHPTENAPAASRDTAGPETGPKCATNAEYVDEAPTGLRSDVVAGWRAIEKAANADGVIVCLNDGKRSTAQQQAQYDEYVKRYGAEAADQLVLPPDKSAHVTGNAIDVQPQPAYRWLQATKGRLGFCRIYDNEPWHFEYDVAYFRAGCPARLPKPER